jgi:hypothetical protein
MPAKSVVYDRIEHVRSNTSRYSTEVAAHHNGSSVWDEESAHTGHPNTNSKVSDKVHRVIRIGLGKSM